MRLIGGHRLALAVAIFVLVAVLVGPLLIPVPPLEGMLPPEALADPDSQFIEIDGVRVHLKTKGQGEPALVLLHGFASGLYTWHAVTEPLSQYGKVIAYDRTGFGLSERPLTWSGQNPYSHEDQVDMIIKLLDHFGIQKAILVGNSAGGTVAMQAALAHPERVTALVLVDPAVYNGGPPGWSHPLLATPQVKHLGPLISRMFLALGPRMVTMAWYNPALVSQEMLVNYQKPFQVENWDKALWEFTLASRPDGLSAQLDRLTLPVLVISGEDDRIVPLADSVRLSGELPNARLVVVPKAGHIPHEEQPQAFMEAVSSFIAQIYPGSP